MLAYQQVHKLLKSRGPRPTLQQLDNQASQALISFMNQENTESQLLNLHTHHQNVAERAMHIFNNHTITLLCGTISSFNMAMWYKIFPEALITLNLLQAYHIHLNLSAQDHIFGAFGAFNFNMNLIDPLGTNMLIHDNLDQRGTWSPHTVDTWYLGSTMYQ